MKKATYSVLCSGVDLELIQKLEEMRETERKLYEYIVYKATGQQYEWSKSVMTEFRTEAEIRRNQYDDEHEVFIDGRYFGVFEFEEDVDECIDDYELAIATLDYGAHSDPDDEDDEDTPFLASVTLYFK